MGKKSILNFDISGGIEILMKPLGVSVASLMQSIQAPAPTSYPGCKMTNYNFSWRPSDSSRKAVVLYVLQDYLLLFKFDFLHFLKK